MHVSFVDVPGEWFNPENRNEYEEAVKLLNESNVLIVAVDTPYLMDETIKARGVLHVEYNKSQSIINGITNKKDSAKDSAGDISNRLVLFVPIKCEACYNQKKMLDVTEMVKEGYDELIDYFKSDNLKNSTTVAIMPILSMGGMEFVAFQQNPKTGRYMEGFQIMGDFDPQYCEQPLLASVMLLLQEARGKCKTSLFFKNWNERRRTKNGEFTKTVVDNMFKVIKPLLQGNDPQRGFEVIQDPLHIFK